MKPFLRIIKFAKNFLAQLAIISLILEQFIFISTATAQSLPITPDGSTNTQVTQTASGVDQINIAAPGANGTSHNKFENYNVNAGGQIINNFSGKNSAEIAAGSGATAVTQTQIGGLVTANSNLNLSGSAKVILNEVTSGNTSQLLGYTEIAGTKADFILANPNGIACHGCGFINTARLLMVAGSSNFDANGNLGFNLKEQANPNLYVPLITIDGLGLDVTRTSGTEIVASSVKLLSSIFGSDSNSVAIRTGEGRYDYATKTITGNNTQNNTDPVFAIDASALAQIQAGQVYMIATKQGVGVKMEGEILASQTLNLDANGDIYYKSISVGETATLRSSGTIKTTDSNSSISAPTINITANQFNNSGLASAYNLNIQNSGTLNNSGNLEALNLNLSNITNINNSGSIFGQNSLSISGTNLTNNSSGSIYSPVDYTIALTGLLTNSGLVTSANNLALNSNQLRNSGEISAQNNLTFSITSSASNSGNLIAGNALNFTADSFTNSGKTQSDSSSTFNLSSLTNQKDGAVYSGDSLNLNVETTLKNSGQISATNDLTITGNSTISNYSKILANGNLTISANSLRSGSYGMVSLLDGISIDINSPDFGSNSDAVISSLTKSLNLSLNANLQNFGELSSSDALTISSPNFANFGNIIGSKNLNLSASFNLFNSGNIQSSEDTTINTASLYNSGLINSLQSATINADEISNQADGVISTTNDLALTSTSLSNLGLISSGNNFTANSSSLTNSGSIYSANNFSITNSADLTNSGTFYSDGSLAILSNSITNNSSAWIYGSKDISLTSNLDLTNAGSIQAATDLTLLVGRNGNNSGTIVGNQLTFTNSGSLTNSGSVASENDIILSATNFTNSGLLQSLRDIQINLSGSFDNQDGSTIYSGRNFSSTSGSSFSNSGEISSVNSATISASSLTNQGSLLANNNLTINATSITNSEEATLASINQALTLNISNYLNNSGTIFAKTNFTLANLVSGAQLNSVTNDGDISFNNLAGVLLVKNFSNSGNFVSGQDLTITSSNSFNNSGTLNSLKNLNITTTSLANSGTVQSGGSSTFNLSSLTNSANSSIYSDGALNLNLVESLNNSGSISSQGNLVIAGNSAITNSNKILSNSDLNISAATLINGSDSLIASLAKSLTLSLVGDLRNEGDLGAITNIGVTSANFSNSGNIIAGSTSITDGSILSLGNLTVNASGSFDNSGNLQSTKDTNINSASSLSNSGLIKSLGKATINASSFDNQLSSAIASNGDLNITAGGFSNLGAISTGNNFVSNSSSFTNSGSIYSANNFSIINASDLINSGTFYSDGSLAILSNNITNNSSAWVYGSKDISLISNLDLTNHGNIQATDDLTLLINRNTDNSGAIVGDQLTLIGSGDIANSGSIGSQNDINLSAANLTNSGLIKNLGNSNLILSGNFTNQSGAAVYVGENLTLNSNDSLNNSGEISAINSATISASSLTNQGSLLANNSLTINTASITNNTDATLASINSALTLNITDYLNNSGTIFAKTNFTLANLVSDVQLNSVTNSGAIYFNKLSNSNSNLKVKNFSNSGNIASSSASDDLTITSTNSFTNQGNLSSGKNLSISTQTAFNNSGTVLATQNLSLTTDSISNSGEISALGNLAIINSNNLTNSNKILSSGALNISTDSLNNNSSSAIASLSSAVNLAVVNDFTNNGQVSSKNDLSVTAKNFTNSGDVLAGAKLSAVVTNQITNSGNFQSLSDSTITTSTVDNSGSIKSFGASAITANSITNQTNAVIYSNLDAAIISANSLTNRGSILSDAKLTINSGSTSNSGEIFANNDLVLSLTNSFTNQGSLSSVGNLTINSNNAITNSNQILSDGDLRIAATALNNSSAIKSNGNITLSLSSLTNSQNISSAKDLSIVSAASVANSGTLQSAGAFSINTNNFTNSPDSLILAGGNLNIRASSVSNQNTKPSNSSITSGIVSAYGAVNIFADSLNNNSGIIAGRSTSVSALNNSSVNLYNTLGAFISTASVSLNLGNLDYTITGTVTASNVDITANNITNQGNVTASDFINLNATGNSGVAGSGNITNGFASNDNSNVQLAAGTYINLVAKNNINNYGTILGTTDTTLTATNGSVNNYSTGEITGGNGTTTVNAANGSFNNTSQTSVFTSNNNAIFNVKDLNNTGEISVANDLTTNITNNLTNNPTALIWSGHDATFNVTNTFLNNQADIYADRNLTIQKNSSTDANQNKTNLVQNISGNIETYSGDINIKAVTLENRRSSMKSQGADYVYGQAYVTGGDCHRNWRGKLSCNPRIYRDLHAANILGAAGLEASIFSGNGITINSNSLLNDASSMISSSNFGINTSIFNNNSYTFVQYDDTNRRYEYYNAYIKSGGALTITQNGVTNPSLINGSNVVQYTASGGNSKQSQNTSINHIDSYQLAQTGVLAVDLSSIINAINNSSNSKNASALNVANAQVGSINKAISNYQIVKSDVAAPTSSDSSNLSIKTSDLSNPDNNSSQTGSLNKTISSHEVAKSDVAAPTSSSDVSTPTASNVSVEAAGLTSSNANVTFSGNFKINLDPAATTPLVESRSQFTDASKFFGSSYYFDQLGLTGSSVLADLDRQTRVNNIRMLGDSFTETKLIMDQLKNLTNDSLFLSKNTTDANQQIKELLDNSVNQFAALGLNAEDVAIKGLTKDQTNSLTKDIVTFELTTVNGISVLAPKIYLSQDTRNRLFNSNSLTGGNALASSSTLFGQSGLTIDSPTASLTNNGSIVSGANLALNIGSLTNKTNSLAQAQIVAANNLSITANTGDIKNIGANIGSLGALNITALNGSILNTAIVQTNDKNLLAQNSESYQLKLGDSARSSGNITSTLLQNASIKGGSVSINAANDFTNLAANISTSKNTLADGSITSGNLSITAGDDINIGTLELRNRTETRWGSGKKGGMSVSDATTNISSNIDSSGSLALFASGTGIDSENSGKLQGSNIQITGSNLSAKNNITLAAKDDVNISAAQNTSYFESQSWKKGLTVSKSSVSGSESVTNVLSNLASDSGNISITSGSDTNLIGAKLKAEDVAVNAGNEVNIYSVSDQNKSWASSTKSRNFSSITGGLVGVAFLAEVAPLTLGGAVAAHYGLDTSNSSKSSSSSAEKTSNLASVIDSTGNISIASNQDLTISGSDISGKSGSLVSDQGSVSILAAQEIEKTSFSSSETARATNVPGFKGSKKTSSENTENLTNIASNLTFTDSLAIQTNGNSLDSEQKSDVNVKGSNLTVTNGDLTIASKGNVTIENAVDSALKESSSKKRNETTKSFSTSTDYVETAASSNLSANNINISSLGDTTIQGSNIDTKENLVIGSFAIAQNPDGTYQKDANGNYVTTAGTTVDNLAIKDADLKEYHYAQSGKGYTGVAAVGMRALPYALAPLQIASSLAKDYMSTYYPDALENFVMKATPLGWSMTAVDKAGDKLGAIKISESTETRTDKSNSHASNINVGGSMMTNSVGDTLVKGSNLNVSGDLLANSLGSFTVAAGTNTESATSQSSYETAGKFHSDYNSTKLNYRAGVTKDFVEEGTNSSSSTVASSNVNIGGSALVNSSDEFALIASNFVTGSSAEIISKNNLNISDGQSKQSDSSYTDKLTLDTGVQVGNAYADAAYAIVDAAKAQKAVKDSYDKLEKIEDLKDQGMASSKAVERAEYQVVLALINAGLSSAAAMQAVGNAGAAASTSFGTGFYGSVYADITKLKSTTTSEYSQSVASNLIAGDSISLTSGAGDINITGSNVSATNGDLNLTAMLGNLNVNAGESTASQSYKMKSQSLGGSVGNNGFSANIGMSEAESSQDQTTYTNSQLLAQNGSLNINTTKDTNLFGANLLASNVNMDVGGNLLLKSRQSLTESDSYNIGMSLGISGDSSGANGGSVGFNLGNGYSNRAWVDQVSSITGTNSVNINVANNTNIVGAVIANKDKDGNDLGNLNLSTASLTYSDLKNFSVSESNQLGLNLQVGKNPNNPTANGNLAINLSMQGSESSSDTKATVGQGNITIGGNLNDETKLAGLNRDINNTEQNKKTVVTSDFEASLKIDLRLIAAAGNLAIGNTDKAAANWDSYATETKRGANITYDALAIPLTSLGKTVSGDVNASDALLATGKNYQNLYQLAYNQNIVLTDLAGEGKLIAYNGDQLDATAQARYADGFYDRNSDTAAINADSNKSDSSLAGSAAHEGGHRMFDNNGQSYTLSEENASHMIGGFAESRWDTYQSGNTSLRASLPTSSINFNNNFYANNVKFGNDVNPLIETAWDAANVALGSASLYKNLQNKNYVDAAVDGVGLVFDTASLVTPFVPGGASTAIKGARAGEEVASGVVKQGSKLSNDHPKNFLDQSYTNRQVSGDEVFYKYHGADNRTGKEVTYLTNKKYSSEEQLRQGLAIDPDWGSINKVTTFKPQKGTWISEGMAAPQKSISQQVYKGGDYQGVINTKNLPKSTIIRTDKLPNGF